jgi:hypothetical protein
MLYLELIDERALCLSIVFVGCSLARQLACISATFVVDVFCETHGMKGCGVACYSRIAADQQIMI